MTEREEKILETIEADIVNWRNDDNQLYAGEACDLLNGIQRKINSLLANQTSLQDTKETGVKANEKQ